MREGLRRGLTPPQVTLRDVPQQVENQLVDDPAQSPLLRAFSAPGATVDEATRGPLRARAIAAFQGVVAPAYRRLLAYLTDEYVPRCRETIGLSALPDG